jgi:hypothetical protein
MVSHCGNCGTGETGCDDATVHLSKTLAVQEMMYGRAVEQRRVDVTQGREVKKLRYPSVMEAGPDRDAARESGVVYAQNQEKERETRIMGQRCDICWVPCRECE